MNTFYLGLMSGTSMDAIDAVIADFTSHPRLIAHHSLMMPAQLRERLSQLMVGKGSMIDYGMLDRELGALFAEAALAVLHKSQLCKADIKAIGSHGQTIYHQPNAPSKFSLQIGDPNTIVAVTGITTVADFRRRDIALGGQGAPLVPAFHEAVFRSATHDRAIINIGGIANITVLPKDTTKNVLGYDIGPGNTLLDQWCQQHQQTPYDHHGAWAAMGIANSELLASLMSDDYFAKPFPKSTGRDYFNLDWLQKHLSSLSTAPHPTHVQATLTDLTALSIAQNVRMQLSQGSEIFICGGGAYNDHLMLRLQGALTDYTVQTTDVLGIPIQLVEALAFAWLAKRCLEQQPGNIPSVTGARQAAVLGAAYFAS